MLFASFCVYIVFFCVRLRDMAQVISTDRSRFKRYWEQQAIQCAAHHRWAEAEKINRSIVKLCPEDVDAYNRLGKALWEMGQLVEAKECYRRALSIDPANSIAGRNLARLESSLATVNEVQSLEELPYVPADIFIAESGKTTIAKVLPLPGKTTNVLPLPGDPLRFRQHGSIMRLLDRNGQPLGQLGAALSQRLVHLIEAGNRYAAAVVGIQGSDIYVVIKETYQHANLVGEHSFPSQSSGQSGAFAYARQIALSADGDALEETDDTDDWADLESETVAHDELLMMEEDF